MEDLQSLMRAVDCLFSIPDNTLQAKVGLRRRVHQLADTGPALIENVADELLDVSRNNAQEPLPPELVMQDRVRQANELLRQGSFFDAIRDQRLFFQDWMAKLVVAATVVMASAAKKGRGL